MHRIRVQIGDARDRVRRVFCLIATFFVIYCSSAFSLSVLSGTDRMLFYLYFILFLLSGPLILREKIEVHVGALFFLFFLGIIGYFFTFESAKRIAIFITVYGVVILYSCIIGFKEWVKAYSDVMTFLAAFSLVAYFLSFFNNPILSRLPIVTNSAGVQAYNLFFSITPIYSRNYGMVWEPGAYQVFLIIALIIEAFYYKLLRKTRFVVLIATIITTFSTAGISSLLFMVIILMYNSMLTSSKKNSANSVFIIFAVTSAILLTNYLVINTDDNLLYTLFGKLSFRPVNRTKLTSTTVRITAIKGSLEVFLEHPIFGVGTTALFAEIKQRYMHSMPTCTFLNWFAMHGFLYGIIMIYGIRRFAAFFSDDRKIQFLLFLLLLLNSSSEDMSFNPSYLLLIGYGFSRREIVEHNTINKQKSTIV